LAIKPGGSVYRWDVEYGAAGTVADRIQLTKEFTSRYHRLRSLSDVSYKLEHLSLPAPESVTQVCDTIAVVSTHTLFGLRTGRFWIGCGGAESGYL
jgi:hypothetical protein